jgi:hypothetical protein
LGDVRQFEAIDQSGCGGIDALETLAWFESSPASQSPKLLTINNLQRQPIVVSNFHNVSH